MDFVGDLAKDALGDEALKGLHLTPQMLYDHVVKQGGVPGAIEAAIQAGDEYCEPVTVRSDDDDDDDDDEDFFGSYEEEEGANDIDNGSEDPNDGF
jgi:hypothetical protein